MLFVDGVNFSMYALWNEIHYKHEFLQLKLLSMKEVVFVLDYFSSQ
jgi:hypothetical protein